MKDTHSQNGSGLWPRRAQAFVAVIGLVFLSGCDFVRGNFTARDRNIPIPIGPPIEDVVTPFDQALSCIKGKVNPGIIFAVGQVVDATGKESYSEGANGKFVTQGAGEMVQSSLFRAGVSVVNRRDPNIAITETQWGIRDLQQQVPVNFYISGSINSLDFIPGGGFSATVAGAGPRFRQNRILIGLDLSMTDAFTGRIVANVPLQKQIFSRELGASVGRFFGDTLVSLDMGGLEREALHFAMRQMLSLATLQLLGQLMNEAAFAPCMEQINPIFGTVDPADRPDRTVIQAALKSSENLKDKRAGTAQAEQNGAQQQAAARAQTAKTVGEQLAELRNQTSIYAARAIAAAEKSLAAETREESAQFAAEAMQLVSVSAQLLKRAAQLGMSGPEGDAAAIVVERALTLASQANEAITTEKSASLGQAGAVAPATLIGPPAAAGTQPEGLPPFQTGKATVNQPIQSGTAK